MISTYQIFLTFFEIPQRGRHYNSESLQNTMKKIGPKFFTVELGLRVNGLN